MTVPLDAAEVTVVNADSWLDYTPQLALLLAKAKPGEVIADASGEPADPERIVIFLSDIAGGDHWPGAVPDFGPGAGETRPERLTMTVEGSYSA